ncbi:manganese catalase family protein [Lacrimispora saccharolytica]|nr:manganese catalase family protein [Lacrimispora saccharolytica]
MFKHILTELGGPDGEMGASMRYLSQRFTAPNRITMGVLTDVGISVPILRTLVFYKLRF